MADAATQPQDGVQVTGPDNRKYMFPKGTTKQQAIQYFKSKGIKAAQAPAKPTAQPSPQPTGNSFKQKVQQGFVSPDWFERQMQASPLGRLLLPKPVSEMQKDETQAIAKGQSGKAALTRFRYGAGEDTAKVLSTMTSPVGAFATGLSFSGLPGKLASTTLLAELGLDQMTKGSISWDPDKLQAELFGMATVAGAPAALSGSPGPKEVVTRFADDLNRRAAELNTKVFHTAKEGLLDHNTSAGLAVAREGIWGRYKVLRGKIEQARMALDGQIKGRVAAATKSGMTIDMTPGIKNVRDAFVADMMKHGKWDASMRKAVQDFMDRLTYTHDPQTGKVVLRPMRNMTPEDAVALTDYKSFLSERAKYDGTPAQVDAKVKLARALRKQLNQNIGSKLPEVQAWRERESSLIQARDSADEFETKILNDEFKTLKGLYSSGKATAGIYLGLKALGLQWTESMATALTLSNLAKSATSRTLRAALYARAADALQRGFLQQRPTTALEGPQGATGGAGALSVPNGPQGPQSPVPQGFTGAGARGAQGAASPTEPPFINAEVVSTNPAPIRPTRGTMLPERATRARAGSGDYVRPESAKPEPKAESNAPSGSVAKSNTKAAAEIGRVKAMHDRLDNLLSRQPKNAMEAAAIQRQVDEIKKVLSGQATRAEAVKVSKHIRDAERLSTKRQEAAAQATPTAMSAGEPVSQTASPEARAVLLERGYQELGKFENGSDYVKALKEQAKAMAKAGNKDYDEVTALADAIKALRSLESQ